LAYKVAYKSIPIGTLPGIFSEVGVKKTHHFFSVAQKKRRMETILALNSLSEMPAIVQTLEILLRTMPTTPYAVVFDIDDTIVRKNSDALPEVLELLFMFHSMGCIIGLITARHSSMREFTVKELAALNIDNDVYVGENLLFCHCPPPRPQG
jgi:hypothetical protein